MSPVNDYLNMQVFETNDLIIQRLKSQGVLIRIDIYTHNYPFFGEQILHLYIKLYLLGILR